MDHPASNIAPTRVVEQPQVRRRRQLTDRRASFDQYQILRRPGVAQAEFVYGTDLRQVIANADQLAGFPIALCRKVEHGELGLDRAFVRVSTGGDSLGDFVQAHRAYVERVPWRTR